MAVQTQITNLGVGALRTDRCIDLVPPHRKIILVQPETVGEFYDILEPNAGTANDIGKAIGQARAFRDDIIASR